MRRLFALLCVALACGPQVTPATTDAPSQPSATATGAANPPRCAGTSIELVESVPIDTTLDTPQRGRTHAVWRAMLDSATQRIDLSQFYVSNRDGGRLEPVLAAIERAAARGVRVRMIADAQFAKTYPDSLARLERAIELRRFDVGAVMGGVQHAKYFLVDGCEAFVGSANFDWRSLEHIHELGVRVRSATLAAALGEVFALDWALAGGASPARNQSRSFADFPIVIDDVRLLVALSPRGWLPDERSWDLPQLVAAIDGARRRVRIQLLGYHAGRRDGRAFDTLNDALRRSAARGVAVELMLSHWDSRKGRIAGLQALQRTTGIDVKLVTIPQHDSGFIPFARVIHAKYMTVDGNTAWVGTSNWTGDYFESSRNVGVMMQSPRVSKKLDAIFEQLWTSPYATLVDPDRQYPPPRIGN